MTHTKGPWTANGPDFGKHTQFEHGMTAHIFAYNPSRFKIADIVGPSNRKNTKEWEANANLIAAAPELLEACHARSLALAVENGVRTLAFPAISCGVYGYPLTEAARIALGTTAEFLRHCNKIDRVVFVLFDGRTHAIFEAARDDLVHTG